MKTESSSDKEKVTVDRDDWQGGKMRRDQAFAKDFRGYLIPSKPQV